MWAWAFKHSVTDGKILGSFPFIIMLKMTKFLPSSIYKFLVSKTYETSQA